MKRERIESHHENELFTAILALKTPVEARDFFMIYVHQQNLRGLVDRWRVAQMLLRKTPYRKIAEDTNVSTATIVRVARFLNNGFGGYKTVMKRLGK